MEKDYKEPCKICGSINQILFDDDDRKSIFCQDCKNYEDIYVSNELQQYWDEQEQQKIREQQTSTLTVTCPYCQSTNASKITNTKKALKIGLFGIFGAMDDAGKTWKCNNCGSKW